MVYQRKVLEYTVQQVAKNLGVLLANVSRTLKIFDCPGTLPKQEYPEDRNRPRKLTRINEFLILQLVTHSPRIHLGQPQHWAVCGCNRNL